MAAPFSGGFDPSTQSGLSGDLGAAGIGLGIFGAIGQMESAQTQASYQAQEAQYSMNIANLDMQVNQQRKTQMYLDKNRQSIENVRKAQQVAALNEATAVQGGAQFGSGAAGSKGQVSAQAGYNELGFQQNLAIGSEIFNLQGQEDVQKMLIAQAQGSAATAAGQGAVFGGIANLGMGLFKSAAMIAAL